MPATIPHEVPEAAVPALPVSEKRPAVAFFARALGFEELRHEGQGLGTLSRDAVEPHVWVADGCAPGAARHLAGSASCRIEVTGIDELYRHCQGLGVVHPDAPLRDTWWGTRELGVLDPDGNPIGLYERVPHFSAPGQATRWTTGSRRPRTVRRADDVGSGQPSIRSTHPARHADASIGSGRYPTCRTIRPSRASEKVTARPAVSPSVAEASVATPPSSATIRCRSIAQRPAAGHPSSTATKLSRPRIRSPDRGQQDGLDSLGPRIGHVHSRSRG